MTKRVTIEIPEKMYFLLSKFGDLHDMDADDYATMALGRHLADIYDLAIAEQAWREYLAGDRKTYTMEEMRSVYELEEPQND
jgi:RHH-type rel operon transcriptional repressor/antitoxin RelB